MKEGKKKILFLCTGNSCRSQMAEGWTRSLKGDEYQVYSAGIEKHGLNPFAVQVMKQVGIDISNHCSKLLSQLPAVQFDYVITVCSNANENCPKFPGSTKTVHMCFEDPPRLAKQQTSQQNKLNCYRKVRDQIKQFVMKMCDIVS